MPFRTYFPALHGHNLCLDILKVLALFMLWNALYFVIIYACIVNVLSLSVWPKLMFWHNLGWAQFMLLHNLCFSILYISPLSIFAIINALP
jgi:hypothetical protein